MALRQPPQLNVEVETPSSTAIRESAAMLPGRSLRPMNDVEMSTEERLKLPRNIDVAPTLDLQDYLSKQAGQKIALLRSSATKYDETEEKAVEIGKGTGSTSVGQMQKTKYDIDRGVFGWTDNAENPIKLNGDVEKIRQWIGNDEYGDLTIQQLVRAHDSRDVLVNCKGDPDWVYEFLNSTGDRPGHIAAKTGFRSHSTRAIAAKELEMHDIYDPDDPEQRAWFSDKIQGALSTVGIVTDVGETHFDMARRGTLGSVIRSIRGNVLCRDTGIPKVVGDDSELGQGIIYQTERWNKRFFLG